MRNLREALPGKRREACGRQACLVGCLHPLHGLHQRLPGQGDRVQKEVPGQAENIQRRSPLTEKQRDFVISLFFVFYY